ncbi:hypothetical protein GH714_034580 [Hevea brasiliensis]|uniref:Glycosyltransferase n=1 Tax=Hevea brasiliensis TaxID=3981 RepID=A0A6A6KWP7_HEVBR|nr:hypothetical protein GH714_034580 [Hevea brasiliensis]
MGSAGGSKPHAVCIPYPSQGHVTPVMQLAKLLHSTGFHITFVNTEFNHRRLIQSRGPDSVKGLPDFRFETITDGMPPSDHLDATQDVPSLCDSTRNISENPIDWIPGMTNIRLKDMPTFVRTTNDEIMFDFMGSEAENCLNSSAIVFNTFDEFDHEVLEAIIACKFPRIYTIGPLSLLERQMPESESKSIASSLWKEDSNCLEWLDKRKHNSVVYVNYGSVAMITARHLKELAWGLANSKRPFLWIIRQDVVMGDSAILPEEFLEHINDRGLLASWCPQDQVLAHPAVGVFLTHCGWNSMMETVSHGVPIVCWPFFADQHTNCRYACSKWGIGMEVNHNINRNEIEGIVKEMIEGHKGKQLREKALEWKRKAEAATDIGGSSYNNFSRLIKEALNCGGHAKQEY